MEILILHINAYCGVPWWNIIIKAIQVLPPLYQKYITENRISIRHRVQQINGNLINHTNKQPRTPNAYTFYVSLRVKN